MKYTKPELEWIRFEAQDILTESDEAPIEIESLGDGAQGQNGSF